MESDDRSRLPFKRLTLENWKCRDPILDGFSRARGNSAPSAATDDELVGDFLALELSTSVPEEVRHLFAVARGMMCYGVLFYPLFTMGAEQTYRVLEAALFHKCRQLGSLNDQKTFGDMIKRIASLGLLTDTQAAQWHAARALRNLTSHATRQSIYAPGMAHSDLRTATELIDSLFRHELKC